MQYGSGQYAPGIDYGDKGRYDCGHNVLLSHARAAAIYKAKYKSRQQVGRGGGREGVGRASSVCDCLDLPGCVHTCTAAQRAACVWSLLTCPLPPTTPHHPQGRLSFSTLVTWPEPATSSPADARAAQNKLDGDVGWFLDPIFTVSFRAASQRAALRACGPMPQPNQPAAHDSSLLVAAVPQAAVTATPFPPRLRRATTQLHCEHANSCPSSPLRSGHPSADLWTSLPPTASQVREVSACAGTGAIMQCPPSRHRRSQPGGAACQEGGMPGGRHARRVCHCLWHLPPARPWRSGLAWLSAACVSPTHRRGVWRCSLQPPMCGAQPTPTAGGSQRSKMGSPLALPLASAG